MPNQTAPPTLSPADQDFIDKLIAEHRNRPGALLTILEKTQEHTPEKYLAPPMLRYVAGRMRIPLAQVFSVVTFYAFFNLEPQGRNTICICRGTACHTRGSRSLLERLKLMMGIMENSEDSEADKLSLTTPDRKYTLRTVACFGQCALAPVVEVNRTIHGHVNEQELRKEVELLS